MSNIYTIPAEVEQALADYYACFDPDTGELIVEEALLIIAQNRLADLGQKSENMLQWYLNDRANRKAESVALSSEIERLQKRLASETRRIDRAENLIEFAFTRIYDGKPVSIGTFTVSYRKSEAVQITDESRIPEDFLRIPEPLKPSPDKTKIKEAIKS
jgi:hypothetical protein